MNMNSFRTGLWMFLLSGCLLATPIKFKFTDFGFDLLTKVSCGNVTFKSPGNIQENCYAAALDTIRVGLHNATTQCDKPRRLNQTLKVLKRISLSEASSNCTWETRKNFEGFVKDIRTFIQTINNIEASKTTESSQ